MASEILNTEALVGSDKIRLLRFNNGGTLYVSIDDLMAYTCTNIDRIGLNTDTIGAQLKILRDGSNDLLLRAEGEIRDVGNPQFGRYLSYIDSNTCNIMTNGAIVINGRSVTNDLVPSDVGGETNFMLGIESDIAGPAIKIKVDINDIINVVNGSNAEVFKVEADGSALFGANGNSTVDVGTRTLPNNHNIRIGNGNGSISNYYSTDAYPNYILNENGLTLSADRNVGANVNGVHFGVDRSGPVSRAVIKTAPFGPLVERLSIDNAGVVRINTLDTSNTPPVTTGTTKTVIVDSNGDLSFSEGKLIIGDDATTAVAGMIRYNNAIDKFQGFTSGSGWVDLH